jgi:hypothetical protein
MHELIAVGIANKVFDEKVAYNYGQEHLSATARMQRSS